MWKDTREERHRRYLECLKRNPDLFRPYQYENKIMEESIKSSPQQVVQEDRETFQNVCDYVLAPSLNSYVLWVLREAIVSGKKRLYFLARDGYLMYRVAQIYCRKFRLPIQCCYLYCSRYSIRIPMFHLNMTEAMDYICRGGIDVNLCKILNRSGLNETEQVEVLEQIGMVGRENDIIPYAEISKIRIKLEACELFQKYVIQHSKAAMPNLAGYLIQEGLLDHVPSALVDSGWVGSMQKVLNQVISYLDPTKDNQRKLEGYYWGLYELPDGVQAADYHCFYFSPGDHLKEKVYFSNCLFEGIFSAPHGMTMGYENQEGYYRPFFADISESHKRFMSEIACRVENYGEKLGDELLKNNSQETEMKMSYDGLEEYLEQMDEEKNHETVRQLLKLFMGEPTRQEAELFGTLQFSDDVLEESGQQMAAPLSQQELQDNHVENKVLMMLGIKKGHVKESAWYEGSAVRSGQDVDKHLRRYAGYKYLLYLRKKRMWKKRQEPQG